MQQTKVALVSLAVIVVTVVFFVGSTIGAPPAQNGGKTADQDKTDEGSTDDITMKPREVRKAGKEKDYENLDLFFRCARSHIASGDKRSFHMTSLKARLLRFNEKRSLQLLVDLSRKRDIPGNRRQSIIEVLQRVQANWGEEILAEWRKSVLAAEKEELLQEFPKKVRNREEFTYDYSQQLPDEEIAKAIKLERKTSFAIEIDRLINMEVTEAKATVQKLLSDSKNPAARQNCLQYLMHLFPEESMDVFISHLDDKIVSVRQQAIRALGRLEKQKAVGALIQQIQGRVKKADEEMALVKELAHTGNDRSIKALLDYSRRNQRRERWTPVPVQALHFLGEFNREDVVEHLLSVAKDKEFTSAYWSLALTGNPEAVNWLTNKAQQENSDMYLAAMAAQAAQGESKAKGEAFKFLESDKYRDLRGWSEEVYLRLLCRAVTSDEEVEKLLTFISVHRLPDKVVEACKKELLPRSEQIKDHIKTYLKQRSLEKYTEGRETAYRCLLATDPQDAESLKLLRKAYQSYRNAPLPALIKYAELRRQLALQLNATGKKQLKYIWFKRLPSKKYENF